MVRAPVVKRPPPPSPSPASVEKASNPIALRYWNQCLEKNSEGRTPTPPTPPTPPAKPEVVRVLSTAGAGVRRAQEVGEARGNISRFITIDQVRRRDGERAAVQAELSMNLREGFLAAKAAQKVVMYVRTFVSQSANAIKLPLRPSKAQ